MRSRRQSTRYGPRPLEDAVSIRDLYSLRLNQSCKVAVLPRVKREAAVKLETSRETKPLAESSARVKPVKQTQSKRHGRNCDDRSSSDEEDDTHEDFCHNCNRRYELCVGMYVATYRHQGNSSHVRFSWLPIELARTSNSNPCLPSSCAPDSCRYSGEMFEATPRSRRRQ